MFLVSRDIIVRHFDEPVPDAAKIVEDVKAFELFWQRHFRTHALFPSPKGIRLIGLTLSSFGEGITSGASGTVKRDEDRLMHKVG